MTTKPFTGSKVAAFSTAMLLSMTLMGPAAFAAEGDNIPIDDSMEELKTETKNDEKPAANTEGVVTVKHIDPSGKELRPSTEQRGKVGTEYVAENEPIKGYEIIGYTKDSVTEGVFTKEAISVTFVYDTLENIAEGKTKVPDGLVAVQPESETTASAPSGGDAQTAAVGDDIPINDDLEELKPDAEAPTGGSAPDANPEAGTGAVPVPTVEDVPRLTPITPVDPNTNPAPGADKPAAVSPVSPSQSFANCDALTAVYPNGVDNTHPAYSTSLDADKDNVACENPNGGAPATGVDAAATNGEVNEKGAGTVPEREMNEIPQASSATNVGMIGAGLAALLAGAASFFMRREKVTSK